MNKLKSEMRRYSYIIYPTLIGLACIIFERCLSMLSHVGTEKVDAIAEISGGMVGVFITVFALYAALPTGNTIIKRLHGSGHGRILTRNIWAGTTLSVLCIFTWLFDAPQWIPLTLFSSSFGNILYSLYYVSTISKYLQNF